MHNEDNTRNQLFFSGFLVFDDRYDLSTSAAFAGVYVQAQPRAV